MTSERDKKWIETWASDVRQFLLADDERLNQWLAFRRDQEQARSEGIDTTKPRNMIKMSDHVYYCPPSE